MTTTNGERIKQAREIRGLTQAELAEQAQVDQSLISLYEQNARSVPSGTLDRIALVTQFPSTFFRQPSGPEFPFGSLLYRRQRGLSGSDAASLRQTGRLVFELISRLEQRFRPIPLRVPEVGSFDPSQAARIARSQLGLSPDTPVTNLVNKLEKAGVYVFRLPIVIHEYDAFSAWSNDGESPRAVIALGLPKSGDRQRFTAAHELAHLVMHRSFLGYPSELDRQANEFAAEFLLPEEAIRQELHPPITLTQLAGLKSRWGTSLQVLMERAEQLAIINQRQKKYLRQKLIQKGWLEREPVEIPVERPRLLLQMLETAYGAPVDGSKAAKLIGTSSKFIEGLVEAAKWTAISPAGENRTAPPSTEVEPEPTSEQEDPPTPRRAGGAVLAFRR